MVKYFLERKIEIFLFLSVFGVMLYLIRWDAIVHGGDQLIMRELARNLFKTGSMVQKSIWYYVDWRDFGYPDDNYAPLPILLQAILFKLTAGWENSFLVVNAFAWSVQVFIWSYISRMLVGRRFPGLLTFLIFSFSFDMPACITTGLKEPLAITFLLLFVRSFFKGEGKKDFFFAGIFLGLSYLCRYNALLVVPVAMIYTTLFWWCRKNINFRVCIKRAAVLLLGFLLITSPWLIRNYLAFGNPLEYLVAKYPFSLHWSGYFVKGYYWDYPPTPANLYSHYGFFFVWKKVLSDWAMNLFKFLRYSYLYWAVAVGGSVVLWVTERNKETVYRFGFLFLLTCIMLPAVFFAGTGRYHIMPFLFLFFICVSIVANLVSSSAGSIKERLDMVKSRLHVASWTAFIRLVIVGFGIIIIAAALVADPLGIGTPGFSPGQKKILGIGIAVLFLGLLLQFAGVNGRIRAVLAALFCRKGELVASRVFCAFLLILSYQPVKGIVAEVRKVDALKSDGVFLLHEEIGRTLQAIAKRDDVVMMACPNIVSYYTDLRAVQTPRYLQADMGNYAKPLSRQEYGKKLDKVINRYGVTLFVDYTSPEVEDIFGDRLTQIARLEGKGSYDKLVTIFRVQ